ncbi:hypothetical protein D3C81_1884800 [compost metagenome]
MDFHAAETSFFADGGTAPEALDDVLDLGNSGFTRGFEKGSHILSKRNSRWSKVAGVQPLCRLFAWVVELHPDRRPLVGSNLRPLLQYRQILLVLNDDIARFAKGSTVNHHIPRNDKPQTGGCPATVQFD